MKKVVLLLLLISSVYFGQDINSKYFKENGEVYFRFKLENKSLINDISRQISIDNFRNDSVYAYANESEFGNFMKFEIKYQVLKHPGDVPNVKMSNSLEGVKAWDSYPTYDVYVQMMQQFALLYPNICRIVDAGNTVQGRKILFAKISDNVDANENEPEFMYTSTMHGDETTGYILMLRLIDSLLTGYGVNDRITNLVNNMEIWINPNGNPDGTYRGGNSTVTGARRYNANNIDINRNFPDPVAGQHPDGNVWQPETIIMMNLAQSNRFVMSANFHGGAEVVNYPWDTWSKLHPDNNWYVSISRKYADTVHLHSPSGYMTYLNNGITNGYAWYRVTGGRQDYYNYFARCREVCIEISDSKLLSGSLLPAHWEYNKRSFLNYMEESLKGLRGVVTNTQNQFVKAKITIQGHDMDNTEVFSDSLTGNYHRPIYPGTYTVVVSADSHITKTFTNIVVASGSTTLLDVVLEPNNPIPVELTSFEAKTNGNVVNVSWTTATEVNNKGFQLVVFKENKKVNEVWIDGNGTTTKQNLYSVDLKLDLGNYIVVLNQYDFDGSQKLSKEIELSIDVPVNFSLSQNFPNPFNPETVIAFALPSESRITLKVFDILGKEVMKIAEGFYAKGNYKFSFDGKNLTSGVYLYRLESYDLNGKKNGFGVRKMILSK